MSTDVSIDIKLRFQRNYLFYCWKCFFCVIRVLLRECFGLGLGLGLVTCGLGLGLGLALLGLGLGLVTFGLGLGLDVCGLVNITAGYEDMKGDAEYRK